MAAMMRSLSSCLEATRMWRKTVRASLEKKPSIKLSQEPCLGVKVNWKRPSGWAASQAFVSLEGRVFAINRTVYAGTGRFDADNSTLTNGFGTRKRRTPRRVLLPESGSTEIAARIGECAAPSCAHAVIVHSAVAITASGRRTMHFLILALIF